MKKLLIALLIAPLCAFAEDKPKSSIPERAGAKIEKAVSKAEKPAAPKVEKADKYQVTGEVSEVTATKIVVMKGTERFEVSRNADTKVNGDLKAGSKVTIKYVMTAATVDVKADDKKETPAKPATKTEKAPSTK